MILEQLQQLNQRMVAMDDRMSVIAKMITVVRPGTSSGGRTKHSHSEIRRGIPQCGRPNFIKKQIRSRVMEDNKIPFILETVKIPSA